MRIVVGIDGSSHALASARQAVQLPPRIGDTVKLLAVAQRFPRQRFTRVHEAGAPAQCWSRHTDDAPHGRRE